MNPNVRKFATDDFILLSNQTLIKKSGNVKLEDLFIQITNVKKYEMLFSFLNIAFEREFYKRLHLYIFDYFPPVFVEQMSSLKGLVNFHVSDDVYEIELSGLKSLEKLTYDHCSHINDFDNLPNCLVNLKDVSFKKMYFQNLLFLVGNVTRLKKVRIAEFFIDDTNGLDGVNFRAFDCCEIDEANTPFKIINLLALNKVRQKLADGRDLKVTIYVEEEAYMATKWAFKDTECGLIRLKRSGGIEWKKNFRDRGFYAEE